MEIKDLIREHHFGEGDVLSESLVSRHLNVSRTPVREALLRLRSEGWLREAEGIGLVLNVISDNDLQDAYILREALEGAAAKLAARNATQPELFALREIAKQFAAAVDDGLTHTELETINARFHKLLYRSSHSALLERILEPLQLATHRDKRSIFVFSSRARESATEHMQIAEALVLRDGDRSDHLARLHVRRGGEARALLIAESLIASEEG